MKVIDLLNKIANGETKEEIMFQYNNGYKEYANINTLFDRFTINEENLNTEIETIEEDKPKTLNDIRESYDLPRIKDKKIEKIPNTYLDKEMYSKYWDIDTKILQEKINEIIDYIEENK
jgi:hypothetical protein